MGAAPWHCARIMIRSPPEPRMEEWWKALEDDCNQELRALFQFESRKMKKLLQKLLLSFIVQSAECI